MCQALSYNHCFSPHSPMEQALLLSPLEVRVDIYIYIYIWITDIFYFTDQVEIANYSQYWPIKFHVNQPKTQSVIWLTSSCHLQLYGWDGTFIMVK